MGMAVEYYSDLGSGYQIAMKDLEIRGAGNLFGYEQSGQISNVGFELYNKILNRAVLERRGEGAPVKKEKVKPATRKELGLSEDKKILILQGSGINVQRGSEEMVEAMKYIDNAVLLVVGGGDVVDTLKQMAENSELKGRVVFKPKQPYQKLMQLTTAADLGLTLDKDTNLNYRFSLPNKLFDYIHAGIPVLASPLPEIKKVIEEYDIGDFIPSHKPEEIAQKINQILADQDLLDKWKKNTTFAASNLTWQNEEIELREVYKKYV